MVPLHGLAWNKKNANEDGVSVAEAFCVGTGSRLQSEYLHKDGNEESPPHAPTKPILDI